ncbi:MAG: DUF4372 domain-containing protein [Pseudomonadota bacterium]
MFSQILKRIPRIEFERLVKETNSEYASKGLASWSQCVAMLFCQLGRAHSLREIEGGLKSCEGKLAHLGIEAPAKSSPAAPTPTGRGSCTSRSSTGSSNGSRAACVALGSSASSTSWSASTRR